MYDTDVVIIGGGPAGTASAITCLEKGLRVIIVESEKFPRHQFGETLPPGIEPLLKKLGVLPQIQNANFLRHKGNWVKWDKSLHFKPFGSDENGPWLGFQAWRANFDAILLDKAVSLGAEIYQPCRAIRPIIENYRIKGVITSLGKISSPFLIDATGRRQWLTQKLKLQIDKYSPRLIAKFGYVHGECPVRDEAPAIIADNTGWTWTAKVRPHIYQWTRLSFSGESLEKNWIPKEFHGLEPVGPMSGADMTWRIVKQCGGRGYFLTGDAAAILDPSSSHGVLKAVMSGMLAGHLIAQVINDNYQEQHAIQGYCKWVMDWFKQDVKKLHELYACLPGTSRLS
ncbi:NAD(P)/FAD-dependent oxidoreductase [Bacillus cereus]|uniref:NAD(P)/FAD-dependent oxidoreductase n=1 Tax=Bacillus cereus TaxID=1396 RepID=UPI001879E9BA|nr:NAD(P)/FAD-dependent oxidoreductase [Bacillus cereus]MBE7099225.1 NAD(P)/FAD-dependent oxidoreductase [Bacillus cereus]